MAEVSTDGPAGSQRAAGGDEAEDHIARAGACVDGDRLAEICAAMVDIPSPPGQEIELATELCRRLDAGGYDAQVQTVTGDLANAHGRRPGDAGEAAGRPSLLLYAPIDTVTTGSAEEDLPWAGRELRPDMVANAAVRDGVVTGLGAHNPKGHGACVLAAALAIIEADVPLLGDLIIGFGGGGMPANARRPGLPDAHGRGCAALVGAVRPDQAIIAKTGWAVSWEEVGLIWFEVEVGGSHTYVGSRHLLPYRNAIADAGHIVAGLERWFPGWAERHRHGLVAPQGVVAAIEGGWPHMPAFTTAVCRFWVDLRVSPRTTGAEAAAEFDAEVRRLADEIDADVRWRQTVDIAGTATDPDCAVIRSTISAWESITGKRHEPIPGLSGATDANIIRSLGVPTARVGLPKLSPARLPDGQDLDFQLGMNAVDVEDMVLLTRLLIRSTAELCGVAS